MKRVVVIACVCYVYLNAYPQCTPHTPTGNPGLTPAPASVPCIERGTPYDFTIYFENFTSFSCSGFTADVNWARIDNLSNLPCGLTWQSDQPSYVAGETGCIRITGTSTDAVGQYALEVHMTFELDIFGSSYTVSGTIAQLQQQLQQFGCSSPSVNTDYYSRVINPGSACPPIGSLANRTSSGPACPPPLSVSISGNTTICPGSSAMLTANPSNASGPVSYSWSQGGSSAQSITVSPTATTTYSVTATDQNGSTAAASATVTVISGCDDGDACTSDACNAGACVFTPLSCDDGNACNGTESCNPATGCVSGTPLVCDDGDACTSDACNAGACVFTPFSCDDGNACNGTESCNPATGCLSGTPLVCDDGDICTSDDCVPETGCIHTPIEPCSVGIHNSTDNYADFEIVPAPAAGMFQLRLSGLAGFLLRLDIFDFSGKRLYAETAAAQNDWQVDLGSLSKGIYVLNLSSEKVSVNKKLVIY